MTYDEILNMILDNTDKLIAPEKVGRNDGYAVFKLANAIAKTQERAEALLESSSTPFNLLTCNNEQLEIIGQISKTPRLNGKRSFLIVYVQNNGDAETTLYAGTYQYLFNGETFEYEVANDITIAYRQIVKLAFFASLESKEIIITKQDSITITRKDGNDISTDFTFSCDDNTSYCGRAEETDIEYRTRLLSYNNYISPFANMQKEIETLEYVNSISIILNNTDETQVISTYDVEPWHLLICISGEIKQEIADIVYRNCLYLTSGSNDSQKTSSFVYNNYLQNSIQIKLNKMVEENYSITITYKLISAMTDIATINNTITQNLKTLMNDYKYKENIVENEIYNLVDSFGINDIKVLNIVLKNSNNEIVPYLSFESGTIGILDNVSFAQVN